jgi:predicted enzyme related to lactoylglutathione lyase
MIRVRKVVLPVQDQDRAKEFWTAKLGYEVVADAPYGAERWLEVRSPDRAVNLVLELNAEVPSTATAPDHLPTSNVMFESDDVVATHRELAAKGVAFPQAPIQQPFGWWAMFSDSEGNRFALGQTGA